MSDSFNYLLENPVVDDDPWDLDNYDPMQEFYQNELGGGDLYADPEPSGEVGGGFSDREADLEEAREEFTQIVESGQLDDWIRTPEDGQKYWRQFKFKYLNKKAQQRMGKKALPGEAVDNEVFQSYSSENTTTGMEDFALGVGATVGRALGEAASLVEPLKYLTKPIHSPFQFLADERDTWLKQGEDGGWGLSVSGTLEAIKERLGDSTEEMERISKVIFQQNAVEITRAVFGIEGDQGGTAELAGGYVGLGIGAAGVVEGAAFKAAPKILSALKFSKLDAESVIRAARLSGGDSAAAIDDIVNINQLRQDWAKVGSAMRKAFGDSVLDDGFDIAEDVISLNAKSEDITGAWKATRIKINEKLVQQINDATGLNLKDADELASILRYGAYGEEGVMVGSEVVRIVDDVAKMTDELDYGVLDVTDDLNVTDAIDPHQTGNMGGRTGTVDLMFDDPTAPLPKLSETPATGGMIPGTGGQGLVEEILSQISRAGGGTQKLKEAEMVAEAFKQLSEGTYASDRILGTLAHYKEMIENGAKAGGLDTAVSGVIHAVARPMRHVLNDMGGIARAMMLDITQARTIAANVKGPIIETLHNIKRLGLSKDQTDVIRGMLDGVITVREARRAGFDEGLIKVYGLLRKQMDVMFKHFESLPPEQQAKIAPYIQDYFPHYFKKKPVGDEILVERNYNKVASNLRERWADFDGYNEDLFEVLNRYASDMADELAYRQVWGKGMAELGVKEAASEGDTVLNTILRAARHGGHTEKQIQYMQKAFNAMTTYRPKDLNVHKMNRIFRGARELQVILKLPLSALRNLTQTSITAMVVDSPEVLKALKTWSSKAGRKEMRAWGREVGINGESMIYDFLQPGVTTPLSDLAGKVLDVSQFNNVEQFNRVIAGWVGKEHAQKLADELIKITQAGDTGSKRFKFIVNRMQEMNINARTVIARGGKLEKAEQLGAANWSIKSTQYSNRPEELSLFLANQLNDPISGDLFNTFVFQFKSFPFKTVSTFYQNTLKKATDMTTVVNAVFGIGAGMATTYIAKHANRLVFGNEEFVRNEAGIWVPADPDRGPVKFSGEAREAFSNFLAFDTFLGSQSPRATDILDRDHMAQNLIDFIPAPTASDLIVIGNDMYNGGKNIRETFSQITPLFQGYRREAREFGPNEMKIRILQEIDSKNREWFGYELD